jgi:hypothetical protein
MEFPPAAVTTAAARQLWQYVYEALWPKGWRVRWGDAEGYAGVTLWRAKTIELNRSVKDRRDQ